MRYIDPDGREDDNFVKEITDCIDEIKIGINEKISLKIPGLINFEVSIDAASYDAVNNKGDESDSGYTQGVTFNLEVGPEGFSAVSGFFKYEKKVQTNAFDLLDADFETSHDLKPNTDLKVTIPIPCIPITINISEAADLIKKTVIKLYNTSKEKNK